MITFTPLCEPYDSKGEEKPRSLAYLAEVDEIRILIDCGAPEDFRFPETEKGLDTILREVAPTIDLVLLCHSDLSHLGLYAYARAHFGLVAPCYSTLPVATMGRLTTLECAQSLRSENKFTDEDESEGAEKGEGKVDSSKISKEKLDPHWCVPTASEINEAFEQINTLRYLQPTQLEGRCAGLTLMAYSAGHTLGGTVWKMRSPSSGTLLIALDWNHNRERHIDGTALVATSGSSAATSAGSGSDDRSNAIADAIRRPDLLITTMARSSYVNARRKDKDAAMLEVIHNTIRGGNTVLIPVDAASRLLELLVLLDQHWAFAYPHVRFPLCLVSHTGREMVERARTLMEWMTKEWARKGADVASADAAQDGEDGPDGARKKQRTARSNNNAQAPSSPLDFKFLRVFSSLAALDEALSPSDPKVILAWPPSLSHGPARKLVARMAANERDVIILTGRGQPNSLTRVLYDAWETQQTSAAARWGAGKVGQLVQSKGDQLSLEIHSKVPLEGAELEAFNEAKKSAKAKADQQRALLLRSARRAEADDDDTSGASDSSDDESDDEGQILAETQASSGDNKRVGQAGQDPMAIDGYPGQEVSFDIYLKGNASRATTFSGTAGERANGRYKTGVRFRTFPVVERKKRIDGYGEMLDLSKWTHRRKQLEAMGGEEAEAESSEAQLANAVRKQVQKDKEEEQRRKDAEPPSKFISETVDVRLLCKLFFAEMDGLSDSRALRTIVPQLEPRRVIFVESVNTQQRAELFQALNRLHAMTKEIQMPVEMERIEVGESTASFTVNLGEEVMTSLRFSSFQDYEVALVQARVNYRTESSIPVLEPASDVQHLQEAEPTSKEEMSDDKDEVRVKREANEVVDIDTTDSEERQLSSLDATTVSQPSTLFIGDLKLSSLKQTLAKGQSPAIPSEFIGQGTLVCGNAAFRKKGANEDDVVTVRKENQGEIVIEGNASRAFYRVRDAVYSLHAQVTGQ